MQELLDWLDNVPVDGFCLLVKSQKIKPPNEIRSVVFSLSKNFQIAPVSAIIEETGVFSWKIGEKTHGTSQSL